MSTPSNKSAMARRRPVEKKTSREVLQTPPSGRKKTSFNLDQDIYESFRRRVFMEGEKMTSVVERLMQRYLDETSEG